MQHCTDQLGRSPRDLRISVTDRCNLRCPYCMPESEYDEKEQFQKRSKILRFEEIERVASSSATLGVTKLRLTGGEPLLRKGLPELVRKLKQIPGIEEVALTTNGVLLPSRAAALSAAGLDRVTISLDSLDPEIFGALSGQRGTVDEVLAGLAAAEEHGLQPVKVNAVIQRGVNEGDILALAQRFHGTGVILRFIEYMDVGTVNGWRLDDVVTAAEIRDAIHAVLPIEPLEARYPGEVARRYRYLDGQGEIGMVASVTAPFCRGCTRLRLSAYGTLYTCLFATEGLDLRTPLRRGVSDQTLGEILEDLWRRREDRYSELRRDESLCCPRVEMFRMGG